MLTDSSIGRSTTVSSPDRATHEVISPSLSGLRSASSLNAGVMSILNGSDSTLSSVVESDRPSRRAV